MSLTPPGNKVVRVAPGGAFWVLLLCLGLLATDAITRLRPGPLTRVLLLAAFLGVAGLASRTAPSITSRSCASTR